MFLCNRAIKVSFVFIVCSSIFNCLQAQQLKKVEYFFDKDPGLGHGVQITLPNTANVDSTLNFDVSALSNGLHIVYVRSQDAAGKWSLGYSASFIKSTGAGGTSGINYITNVEYFFDKDPGVGKATRLAVNNSSSIIDSTISFNVSSLSNGLHTLFVRSEDENQNWSLGYNSSFIKQIGNDSMLTITKLEYFIDVDPGFGNGIPIPITAAADINDTANFIIPDNGADARTLYVRAQDSRGSWSLVYDSSVNLCDLYKPKSNFSWIQFGNHYSFIDSSQNNPTHKLLWEFQGLGIDSVSNPLFTFPQGSHYVTLISGVRGTCRADTITLPVFTGLESYYPAIGMAGGDLVLNVYGGGLDTNAVITLKNTDITIAPYAVASYDLQAFAGVYDLHTAQPGIYDINVHFANGYDTTIVGGFQLLAASANPDYTPEIDISVVGVHVGRPGTVLHHKLIVTNSGMFLAKSVPIWIAAPNTPFYQPFQTIPAYNNFIAPDNNHDYQDSVPKNVAIDTLFGQPYQGVLNNFIIPSLNGGESYVYPYDVQLPNQQHGAIVEIDFWPSQELYGSPFKWNCIHTVLSQAASAVGVIPVIGCGASLTGYALDVTSGIIGNFGGNNDKSYTGGAAPALGNFVWSSFNAALGCIPFGSSSTKALLAAGYTTKLVNGLSAGLSGITWGLQSTSLDLSPCYTDDDPFAHKTKQELRDINSVDPNGINGPEGYGKQNYINGKGKLGYEIDFENKPVATANAQRVYISDTLDKTKFDLSTFELSSVSVGDSVIAIPYQLKEFTTTKDLRPSQNLLLRINAKLDTATGILTCSYLSIDPVTRDTLRTADIRGFLPPDVDNFSGIGTLDYVVALRKSLVTGDVVNNTTSIIFDNNAPLSTNTWINTVDKTAPAGNITGSTPINDSTILLHINSSDIGTGVDHSAIFMSTGNQPSVRAGIAMRDTIRFTGQADSTYHFYIVSYDSVNNFMPKGSPDYSVTFTNGSLPLLVTSFTGVYANGTDHLTTSVTNVVNVKEIDLQKSFDGIHFIYLGSMAGGNVVPGTYNYNDVNPLPGNNYYRLKVIDIDGLSSYSNVVLLNNSKQHLITCYPNPVTESMTIEFNNVLPGSYKLVLTDIEGKTIQSGTISILGNSETRILSFSGYAPGNYILSVIDNGGNRIINKKIVKE